MQATISGYKYLTFCELTDLRFWDYYTLSHQNLVSSSYPIVELKQVLTHRKKFIAINNEEYYKRCRVQVQGKGVVLRDTIIGKEIKTKKQQLCKVDDFLVAEIDAKVGGFGVVPKELEGAVVSGHYFLFDIDAKQLLPEYLGLIVKTNGFLRQVKSTGSTNYAAIRPHHVMGYKIPLPTIPEQKKIVEVYNEEIDKALRLKGEVENIEQEIETYFLTELGLPPFKIKSKIKGLFTINFMDLERWDFFSTDVRIAQSLSNTNYPVKTIGSTFKIAKRSWDKRNVYQKTFRYIEIGAIDPIKGILRAKPLPVDEAPSRATQTIREGDLIIGTTRPYLKKFAIVGSEYDGDVCSSGFTVIPSSPDYYLPYLMQFLKCAYGIEQLKNRMSGGLYPAITERELKEVKIPLPDIKEQEKIMEKVQIKEKNILSNKALAEKILTEVQEQFEQRIFESHEN